MEFNILMQAVIALVLVLALIGLLAWLIRRFGGGGRGLRTRTNRRRLVVVEVAPIDSKRRLVLVRRDETEHLVLLGTTADILIEAGIAAPPNGGDAAPNGGDAAPAKDAA
jgi:flagellar protein FliO/FliZ